MNDLRDLTLDKLGDLTREVRVEDCSYLDVLTIVRALAMSLRMSGELTKNADQISLKGHLTMTPLVRASNCAPTLGANRCGIGEWLSGGCTGIFKRTFEGLDQSRSCH